MRRKVVMNKGIKANRAVSLIGRREAFGLIMADGRNSDPLSLVMMQQLQRQHADADRGQQQKCV